MYVVYTMKGYCIFYRQHCHNRPLYVWHTPLCLNGLSPIPSVLSKDKSSPKLVCLRPVPQRHWRFRQTGFCLDCFNDFCCGNAVVNESLTWDDLFFPLFSDFSSVPMSSSICSGVLVISFVNHQDSFLRLIFHLCCLCSNLPLIWNADIWCSRGTWLWFWCKVATCYVGIRAMNHLCGAVSPHMTDLIAFKAKWWSASSC